MQNIENKPTVRIPPMLHQLLALFELVALAGTLYCGMALVLRMVHVDPLNLLLYTIWFAIAVVSLHTMRRGDALGAYALALVTAVVTVFDIANGTATIGGASLGMVVFAIVIAYMRYVDPLPIDS